MYINERYYIEQLGLLSVVVMSSRHWETRAGGHVVEDIVCLKGEKPYRMSVHWLIKKNRGPDYRIEKKKPISEEEYINHIQESSK